MPEMVHERLLELETPKTSPSVEILVDSDEFWTSLRKDGTWLKAFYTQPRKWHIGIHLNTPTIIKYEFHVRWAKDEFRYRQK